MQSSLEVQKVHKLLKRQRLLQTICLDAFMLTIDCTDAHLPPNRCGVTTVVVSSSYMNKEAASTAASDAYVVI